MNLINSGLSRNTRNFFPKKLKWTLLFTDGPFSFWRGLVGKYENKIPAQRLQPEQIKIVQSGHKAKKYIASQGNKNWIQSFQPRKQVRCRNKLPTPSPPIKYIMVHRHWHLLCNSCVKSTSCELLTLIRSDRSTYGSATFGFGHRSGENASERK